MCLTRVFPPEAFFKACSDMNYPRGSDSMPFEIGDKMLPGLNITRAKDDEIVVVGASCVSPLAMDLAGTHQQMLEGKTGFRNLEPSDVPHFELIADMAEALHDNLDFSDPENKTAWFREVWRSGAGAPIDSAKLYELTASDIKPPSSRGFFAFPHRMALAAADQVFSELAKHAPSLFEFVDDHFFFNDDWIYRVGMDIGNGAGSAMEQLEHGVLDMVSRGGIVRGLEFAKPRFLPSGLGNMQASLVAGKYGICGGSATTNSACNSAGASAANIFARMASGLIDIGVVGGTDYVEAVNTRLTFDNMMGKRGALTRSYEDPEHPLLAFASNRDGFSPGDYGGMQVWMRRSIADQLNVPYRLKVLSASHTGDPVEAESRRTGKKISETNGSVVGQAQAMQIALKRAGVTPDNFKGKVVHWLHATGTSEGAKNEFTAIAASMAEYLKDQRWFGTSTKENMGHSLGGAMQQNIDTAYQSMVAGKVPFMPSTKSIDPALLEGEDQYMGVTQSLLAEVEKGMLINGRTISLDVDDIVAANAFGFGGTNGVIIMQPVG